MVYRTAEDYTQGLLEGDKVALAKAITLIESTLPMHQKMASEMLSALLHLKKKTIRLGITGAPGAGKSTFIEALGLYAIKRGFQVAVLAIDPSSTITKGSILADKTRMEKLAASDRAFIRPSPSSTHLGGVAKKTREAMIFCEAAGYDFIMIETVGVGQSEVQAASMVDFFLLLMQPNSGDELQGLKKGIIELADAIIVNKADKNNMQEALRAKKVYENALHIATPLSKNWRPPVLTCSALEGRGFEEIWEMIIEHNQKMSATGELRSKRQKQSISWMWNILNDKFTHYIFSISRVKNALQKMIVLVEQGEISSEEASEYVFEEFLKASCKGDT